jgi:hypothetical protein
VRFAREPRAAGQRRGKGVVREDGHVGARGAEERDVAAPCRRDRAGLRSRIRRLPAGPHVLRVVVFLTGLFFVALGVALAALPGPLTIPPVLLGVWIWATEFHWARRLHLRVRRSADATWLQVRRRPVASAVVTSAGLLALGVGIYLVGRYEVLDLVREAAGR